ncbi:ABC transporter substrate-binding protein [Helicobacter sp. 11S02596-1]|uniref:ABC transporter substrate-binding protein n=1 Tax=Helicobacter sp. 11S02596-1 TaxID=1476194 RepID=UPI000BA667D7|nr:ABC transporter substrate-binding protein [Helicobacter sp. 11S02596-1]PAF42382.1 hypothetical protein BJI48_07170 [Helicobacter sp. 11S02596-1]
MKKFIFLSLMLFFSCGAVGVKDSLNHIIEIPQKIERIAVVGGMWPLPSIIVLLDSSSSRLVQIPKASKTAIKASVLADFYPEILNIHDGNTENIEEILNFKPDIALCHQANKKLCSTLNSLGIPTLTLSVNIQNYNYKLTLKNWLEILGQVLGKQALAEKLINANEKIEKQLQNQLKNIANKPKAMILHRYSENEIVANGLFANYLLEHSGAENVFADFKTPKKVSLEEIYRRDPDIIYITNFTPAMPEDLFNSKLWADLRAIKNKRVYKIPLGTYRWFAPSAEFPVFLIWLAKHNHPELFVTWDISKDLFRHFKEFYNKELTLAQIHQILFPSPEAGKLQ